LTSFIQCSQDRINPRTDQNFLTVTFLLLVTYTEFSHTDYNKRIIPRKQIVIRYEYILLPSRHRVVLPEAKKIYLGQILYESL